MVRVVCGQVGGQLAQPAGDRVPPRLGGCCWLWVASSLPRAHVRLRHQNNHFACTVQFCFVFTCHPLASAPALLAVLHPQCMRLSSYWSFVLLPFVAICCHLLPFVLLLRCCCFAALHYLFAVVLLHDIDCPCAVCRCAGISGATMYSSYWLAPAVTLLLLGVCLAGERLPWWPGKGLPGLVRFQQQPLDAPTHA